MHYTRQVNKLIKAINLILPHVNPDNELRVAMDNIVEVVEVIWDRYNHVDPSKPSTRERLEKHWRRERNMARVMIKYHKEFKLAKEREQGNDT